MDHSAPGTPTAAPASPPAWRVALALGTVYVVWGSTYMAIWVAAAGMPNFVMGAMRFALAAALLAGAALVAGHERPRKAEIAGSALVGTLLLGVGNGGVVFAAGRLPSGLAALLVASLPLWVLVFEAITERRRPGAAAAAAVAVGFAGVAALLWPDLAASRPSVDGGAGPGRAFASAIVLIGTAIWAVGQLLGRRLPTPTSWMWNAACSLAAASLVFVVAASAAGEWPRLDLAAVPASAWLAFVYLVLAGSCVAWSAFAWLVRHVRPSLVSTYAYVNPLVAVLLGTLFLAEPFTSTVALGGALVVAAVALAIRAQAAGPAA